MNAQLVNCNITLNIVNYINAKRFKLKCINSDLESFLDSYQENLGCNYKVKCNSNSNPCNNKKITII